MHLIRKPQIRDYLLITSGSLLFCSGLNFFITPVGLYNGGTVGIAQILRTLLTPFLKVPEGFDMAGIFNLLINLPILYLAYRKFGRDFFEKTVFSIMTQTLFFCILPVPSVPILTDRLAACMTGGLMTGAGVGITLRYGGSGGGNDVIGLFLMKKYRKFSIGTLTLAVNGIIYTFCAFLFELPTAIFSAIYSVFYSLAANRTHLQNINSSVLIFTKKPELYKTILTQMNRDSTCWKGAGAYTESDTFVVISIMSKHELSALKTVLEKAAMRDCNYASHSGRIYLISFSYLDFCASAFISRAFSRTVSVISAPPNILASSSTTWLSVRGQIEVTVLPLFADFAISK